MVIWMGKGTIHFRAAAMMSGFQITSMTLTSCQTDSVQCIIHYWAGQEGLRQ